MKHLFYIHSAITYFVALEVIREVKLDKRACILMYGRGFQPNYPDPEIEAIELPYTHYPENSFAIEREFWKSWGKLISFDSFVAKITEGQLFHVYTNQTGINFIRLFISHQKCSGFSFLEEGLYSYYSLEQINDVICPSGFSTPFYKFLNRLNYLGRLSGVPAFFSEKYEAVYGINNNVFPGFRNRVILSNPFYNSDASYCLNGHIVALDALYEYGVVGKAFYEQAIHGMFLHFSQQNIKRIWVKYHPEQYANPKCLSQIREIIQNYSEYIEVNELPQSACLELVAGNKSGDVTFYVFLSSVGMYAGFCDRKVNSFAKLIAKYDVKYEQRIASLPPVFKKYVKFL